MQQNLKKRRLIMHISNSKIREHATQQQISWNSKQYWLFQRFLCREQARRLQIMHADQVCFPNQ